MRPTHSGLLYFLLLTLVAGLAISQPALGQRSGVLAPTGKWVTDNGDFLSSSEETSLSAMLAHYADTTSTQIIIVTLQSLEGWDAGEYATELGRAWGVGQAGHDNGVVILTSREERQVFIATGYGLEGAIPDVVAGRIIRNIFVPAFREGQYYRGFANAVHALIQAANGEFDAVPDRRPSGEPTTVSPLLVFFILYILLSIIRRSDRGGRGGGKRYRSRRHSALPWIVFGSGLGGGGGSSSGGGFGGSFGGGFGGGGFGGFGGGGGSFGGGGAGGGW